MKGDGRQVVQGLLDPVRTCAASLSELGNVGGFVSKVIQLCDVHFKKDSFGCSVKNTVQGTGIKVGDQMES